LDFPKISLLQTGHKVCILFFLLFLLKQERLQYTAPDFIWWGLLYICLLQKRQEQLGFLFSIGLKDTYEISLI